MNPQTRQIHCQNIVKMFLYTDKTPLNHAIYKVPGIYTKMCHKCVISSLICFKPKILKLDNFFKTEVDNIPASIRTDVIGKLMVSSGPAEGH